MEYAASDDHVDPPRAIGLQHAAPGSLMSPTGRFDEFIRLPFDHESAVLREGVQRLASAWQSYAGALDSYGSSRMDVIV